MCSTRNEFLKGIIIKYFLHEYFRENSSSKIVLEKIVKDIFDHFPNTIVPLKLHILKSQDKRHNEHCILKFTSPDEIILFKADESKERGTNTFNNYWNINNFIIERKRI